LSKKSAHHVDLGTATAQQGDVARFTDARFAPTVKKLHARLATDRNFAIQFLHEAGIVTKKGNLTKRFGG